MPKDFVTFDAQDLFILDGQTFTLGASTASGVTLVATEPPHISHSLTRAELADLLGGPRLRHIPRGLSRPSANRPIAAPHEHLRDYPPDLRGLALWREDYVRALLAFYEAGRCRKTEASVSAVLPELIARVETGHRRKHHARGKRAGSREPVRTPPCAKTLLTWARRYETGDRSPLALLPQSFRSGRRGARLEPGELAEFFLVLKRYAAPTKPSINTIKDELVGRFRAFDKIREQEGLPLLRMPSRSAVYRGIRTLDPYETYLQREGVQAANRKFRISEFGVSALRPMERIEIDEWEVDLITLLADANLLHQLSPAETRAIERVRRCIHVAIDCATRCVVGLSLCATPNAESAIRALESVTVDKTSIGLALGANCGWSMSGRPERIVTDQGAAFVSDQFKTLVSGLWSILENPPAGQPALRARIERLFGTFARHFVACFRGRTFSNPVARGDYAAEDEACLTDRDLLEALVTYIVDVYHNRPHEGLFGETPANCWARLTREDGPPAPVDATARRAIFGVELTRTVTGSGVRVFGADFASEELRAAYLRSHQREVRLRFDRMDLGWVVIEIDRKWYPAHDLSGALAGVSFAAWQAYRQAVIGHNRAEAELTADIFHAGLKRLTTLSEGAAERARLDSMIFTADELDRAEKQLSVGLHFLPQRALSEPSQPRDWFNEGFETGTARPDPEFAAVPDALSPPARSGWRLDIDD